MINTNLIPLSAFSIILSLGLWRNSNNQAVYDLTRALGSSHNILLIAINNRSECSEFRWISGWGTILNAEH
jgi:hypothetical protein